MASAAVPVKWSSHSLCIYHSTQLFFFFFNFLAEHVQSFICKFDNSAEFRVEGSLDGSRECARHESGVTIYSVVMSIVSVELLSLPDAAIVACSTLSLAPAHFRYVFRLLLFRRRIHDCMCLAVSVSVCVCVCVRVHYIQYVHIIYHCQH